MGRPAERPGLSVRAARCCSGTGCRGEGLAAPLAFRLTNGAQALTLRAHWKLAAGLHAPFQLCRQLDHIRRAEGGRRAANPGSPANPGTMQVLGDRVAQAPQSLRGVIAKLAPDLGSRCTQPAGKNLPQVLGDLVKQIFGVVHLFR